MLHGIVSKRSLLRNKWGGRLKITMRIQSYAKVLQHLLCFEVRCLGLPLMILFQIHARIVGAY